MSRFATRFTVLAAAILSAATAASASPWVPNASGSNSNISWTDGQNATDLFGNPSVLTNGLITSFIFNPVNFTANAPMGAQNAVTATDTAKVNITAATGKFITRIQIIESGDYSGLGTPLQISASGTLVTTDQTNGGKVVSDSFNTIPNFPVTPPPAFSQWGGVASVNYVPLSRAVNIVVDDILQVLASPNSTGLIQKKSFEIRITVVPEPTSMMALAPVAGLVLRRRR